MSERTNTVADYKDSELVERAFRNARRKRGVPLWSSIADAFGLGSTYACELCLRFDHDPHRINGVRRSDKRHQ
jgi:hypothetical protein